MHMITTDVSLSADGYEMHEVGQYRNEKDGQEGQVDIGVFRMAQQQPQRRTIVVLNLDHVAKAFEAAKKIAEKTGQKLQYEMPREPR